MTHLHGLLLLSCIALLVPAIAGGQREAAEALLKWKASLTDADASLTSWSNATSSPCNWAFVSCSSTGDVTALSIINARINGTLAGLDFSAFPRLEELVLDQNDLYGTIPEGIGNLTSLIWLGIYGQSLSGPIPRSIGQLKQLAHLQLADLELSGTIPVEIGNLTSLQEMQLSGNNGLTGLIPPAIGKLEKLSSLDLSSNNLKGSIPSQIGNMTELETMVLNRNYLEGELPGTLSRLQKLGTIAVSDNQLGGRIAQQLGNNNNLTSILIASNNFSGISVGPICTLLSLVANNNKFASLQDINIQNCTSLQYLDLARNGIRGDLNEWLRTLPKRPELTRLILDENNITGRIPPVLGNMTSLWFLNLAHNQLTGAIPPELGKLYQLSSLDLSYNQLSGSLPLAFQNFSHLAFLGLTSCSLTGQLHDLLFADKSDLSSNYSSPGNLMLALSSNHISGTIPKLLCNAIYLAMLDLSNNALHGDLPNCLWDLASLQFMDLSNNFLSGVVPLSRSSNITLQVQSLHLANNLFEGNFPSAIRKCNKLITLDLGENNFTGELPSWIAKSLPQLRYLRLPSNMFHGVIPEEILQFQQLQLLDLSHNKLSGPIPVDFANFTGMTKEQADGTTIYGGEFFGFEQIQLVWKNGDYEYSRTIAFIIGIDLSCNSLSQAIPEAITTLSGIKYLNCSRNKFSGGIPKDIGNLALLESLDLSWNQLEGEIPLSVADLKYLSTLNLSNNDLSGRIPGGSQLQTLDDPSIYSNNPGLCGFPLKECANASGLTHNQTNPDDDREALWLACFVVVGVIFGFWLSWGVLFCKETWRYALYRYVDNMLEKEHYK